MGIFCEVTFNERYRYYENSKNCSYPNVNMSKTTYAEVQNASLLSTLSKQMNKHIYAFLDHGHILVVVHSAGSGIQSQWSFRNTEKHF